MTFERRIKPRGPFRLATAVNILRRTENPPLLTHLPASFQITQEVPGGAVEVHVRQEGPGADVLVTVLGAAASDRIADQMFMLVAHIFSLRASADGFYSLAREDVHMRRVLTICPDVRPVLYPTPYEGLVTAILSYRQTIRETASFIANLREVAGVVPVGRPQAQAALPGKHTLLATPVRLLELAGLPRAKLLLLKRATAHLVGEPDLLERLEGIDDIIVMRRALQQLPGINRAIAMHMIQYAYGNSDLLLDSLLLRRAVKRFYQLPDVPDDQSLLRLSNRYERWRSWWSFALLTANEQSVIV